MKVDSILVENLENNKANNHRSLFVLSGKDSPKQIPQLHKIYNSVNAKELETLVIYKKKKIAKSCAIFNNFLKTTPHSKVLYNETDVVLGNTFDVLILIDFEVMTPNNLAKTVETVRGGGMIIFCLEDIKTYIESSFYFKRLFLKLVEKKIAIFLNDKLEITQETKIKAINSKPTKKNQTKEFKFYSKSKDQENVLENFIELLNDRTRKIIALSAGRGRGKSAAMGILSVFALKQHSLIQISAPLLENLKTFFEFAIKTLKNENYDEKKDFKIFYKEIKNIKYVKKILITKNHNQIIEYVSPFEELKQFPDLVIIDEAAAIPLPCLNNLIKANTVFVSSTISGYEGTGKALSLKFFENLKKEASTNFVFQEKHLSESIRYSSNDPVEKWLISSLILDTSPLKIDFAPSPDEIKLVGVNKKILFSNHSASEKILEDLTSLFVSSHYKNSPDDLQIFCDSPNHYVFVGLSPVKEGYEIPRIIFAVHFSIENDSKKEGNLIKNVLGEYFLDNKFKQSLGIRIVRICVHPDFTSMGYGSFALNKLYEIFSKSQINAQNGKTLNFEDQDSIFCDLENIKTPKIDWIGSSFGCNSKLLGFWKKNYFFPVYLKMTPNSITGEHSTIVIKSINESINVESFREKFSDRFINLLSDPFKNFKLDVISKLIYCERTEYKIDFKQFFTNYDIERLDHFVQFNGKLTSILDILPSVAFLIFKKRANFKISNKEASILILKGLQFKSNFEVQKEMKIDEYEFNILMIGLIYKIFFKNNGEVKT